MAKASLAVSAENTWSDKFHLSGDGAGWGRRALVLATRDDSTVTLRRYNAAGDTVLASIDMDSAMTAVEVPVSGLYDVGVATGSYGGAAMTITVEQ